MGGLMGEDQATRIEMELRELRSALSERCAARQSIIERNTNDINKAFDKIRAVQSMVHDQDKLMAKWSGLAAVGSSILTAVAVKFFVG